MNIQTVSQRFKTLQCFVQQTSKSTGTEDKGECKPHEKTMRETSRKNQNNHLRMEYTPLSWSKLMELGPSNYGI